MIRVVRRVSPFADALGRGAVADSSAPLPDEINLPIAMGNVGFLADAFDPDTWNTAHNGTGSVSTLPMTAERRRRPIGFVWLADGSDDGTG